MVIQFDVNPLGMSTDFMLFASLNPLEIVYDSVSGSALIVYVTNNVLLLL